MSNSKFAKVKVFAWDTFFSGAKAIQVKDNVTIEDLKAWINNSGTGMGAGGNYKIDSIVVGYPKVKVSKIKYTEIPSSIKNWICNNDVSFMYPNPSAIVPMPHFKFKITANEDELLKHGYNSKHYWERSRTPEGALIAKELFTRLPTKEATQALYNEMIDKGFTHLKKVISLE